MGRVDVKMSGKLLNAGALGVLLAAGNIRGEDTVKASVPETDIQSADPYLWLEDVTGEKQLT